MNTDFITLYREFADRYECPGKVHEFVGLSLLAAALNPRVTYDNGGPQSLDLWLLILSGSGMGRNTSLRPAKELLRECEMTSLVMSEQWGSRQAMYQQLAEHPNGLLVLPEMGNFLLMLADSKFAGAKEWLTDRYDEFSVPSPVTYRATGKKGDTPPIEFPCAPRLNMLATSSEDWFTKNLNVTDTTGGFIPRFLLVRVKEPGRLVPIPGSANRALLPPLVERLKTAAALEGNADLRDVLPKFCDWYKETHARFAAHTSQSLALPFFNRARAQVLKLAVVYEVSQSGTLKVSHSAMDRAIATMRDVEAMVFDLLRTGLSHEGAMLTKIEERVRQAGSKGLSQSDLTRAFQDVPQRQRQEFITTLEDGGRIRRSTIHTSGRNATKFVHEDFSTNEISSPASNFLQPEVGSATTMQ